MAEQEKELDIFSMIDEMARGRGKRKSEIKDFLDEVMANPNLEFKHPPMIPRTPFIYAPVGEIVCTPKPKSSGLRSATELGRPAPLQSASMMGDLAEYIEDLSKSTKQELEPTAFDLLDFKPVAAFVISTEDSRDLLIRGMRAFFGGTYHAATLFNREFAAKAIHGLFEDYLFRQLYWHNEYRYDGERLMRPADRYDRVLSNFLPPHRWTLPDNEVISFTDQLTYFETEVSDQVRTRVFDRLLQVIPEPTYDIYRSVPVPGGILLEKGPDFRVVDWTRRMENGEWR